MFWLGKWVPHELIENQNAAVLKCLLLLYATTMNHFSIRLWHVSESGFYMTTSHAQLSGWTKKQLDSTFQSQTYIKKKWVMATLWWSAAHLIHYSFLNLSETITSKKYAQQNQRDVLRTATPEVGINQQKRPDSSAQPMLQKLNELGYKVLLHLPYFTSPLTNRLSLL